MVHPVFDLAGVFFNSIDYQVAINSTSSSFSFYNIKMIQEICQGQIIHCNL